MTGKNNRVKSTNDIELKDRLVAINRVTKVTKGGRTFSFSAIVVVGNEAGIVGWGLGKASEVTTSIAKGVEAAAKKENGVALKGSESILKKHPIFSWDRNRMAYKWRHRR